jgi:hypothetical protein
MFEENQLPYNEEFQRHIKKIVSGWKEAVLVIIYMAISSFVAIIRQNWQVDTEISAILLIC